MNSKLLLVAVAALAATTSAKFTMKPITVTTSPVTLPPGRLPDRFRLPVERATAGLFDEDEEPQALDAAGMLGKVVEGVLVPIGTKWVKDRIHDIERFAKNHKWEDDEDEMCIRNRIILGQKISDLAKEAADVAMVKTDLKNTMLMDEDYEDEEQIGPVLVWIGGVLYEVLQGVVINILVDRTSGLIKKLSKGHKLWDEEEEEEQYVIAPGFSQRSAAVASGDAWKWKQFETKKF